MRVLIINSSDTFEYRVDLLYQVFTQAGHEVMVIGSDYMHIEKKRRKSVNRDYFYLKVIPYYKNISLRRIISHIKFSVDAERCIKKKKFDVLYIVAPPNTQTGIAKKYYKNREVKIIIDIIDLWPESFPISNTEKFPFSVWAAIRNSNLKYADIIITECNLYKERLQKYLLNKKVETIYWTHIEKRIESNPCLDGEKINLCYLGSINNIIDISLIGNIIEKVSERMSVVLRIIGDGEKCYQLISTASRAGAEVIFYGKIYDLEKKQKIFDMCNYGLNIMKKNVCVGLSMKSIEYFMGGLPIINNLSGDTKKFVEMERCGINWECDKDADAVIKADNLEMRKNSRRIFESKLKYNIFEEKMLDILEQI